MTELLRTEHLTRHFKIGGALSQRTLHAVDDVSFGINEREIVALAGESGSGKSTIARMLARIYRPTFGEIYFEGKPLSQIRSRRDQLRYSGLVPMVFQDPFGSINPVFRVQHGVLRSLKLHRPELSAAQRLDRGGAGVRGGRAERRHAAALPLRAERRAAAAGRLRPGAGDAAEADPGRRAGLDAGRVDQDRPAQPDDEAARRGGRVHPLHHPRHRQRAVRGGPADRDVRRPDRRDRADRGRADPPQASLHPAAAFGGARSARAALGGGGDRPRRAAQGDRPDAGLPVPLAVPPGHRHLRAGHASAGRAETGSRRGLSRRSDQCRGSEGPVVRKVLP